MRTINPRVLIVLVSVTLLAGATFYGLHQFQLHRHASFFLEQARQAQAEEDYETATKRFRNYLKLKPNDAEVLSELGLLLADRGAHRAAYRTLEKALRRAPERDDVRRKLVEEAMALGRFSDAREHLEGRLLETSPDDPELLERLGHCQAVAGENEQAVRTFQQSIEKGPTRGAAYVALAYLLESELDRPDEGAAWMDRLVEANPESAEAYLARAEFRRQNQEIKQALADAEKAVELDPESAGSRTLAATCALESGQGDLARRYAERGIELAPDRAPLYAVVAGVAFEKQDVDEAIGWLRRGIEAAEEDGQLRWALVDLFLKTDRLGEAEEAMVGLRATEYPAPLVGYHEARIALAKNQWRTARDQLEELRTQLTLWPGLLKHVNSWLGQCYGQLQDPQRRVVALRKAVAVNPKGIRERAELAQALWSAGQREEALDEYRRVLQLPGAPASAGLELARRMLARNLSLQPSDRDWTEVDRLLGRLKEALPQDVGVDLLRADVLVGEGHAEEAEQMLRERWAEHPEEEEVAVALADVLQGQAKWPQVEELLHHAQKAMGDRALLRLARARYLVRRRPTDAVAQLGELAKNSDGFPESDQERLWSGLMAAAIFLDAGPLAREMGERLAASRPQDLAVHLRLFELALAAGDQEAVVRELEAIKRIEGQGPLWHFGEALRLRALAGDDPDTPSLEEALDHLASAREMRPNWSRVPQLVGEIYQLQGDTERALEEYLEATGPGDPNSEAALRAVRLLYGRRRFKEADQLLRRVVRQHEALSPDLQRLASDLYFRQQEFDRGLELARKSAATSEDYRDHLWLGQISMAMGRRAEADGRADTAREHLAEAEKALRHAVELSPSSPEPWVTLVYLLVQTQRTEGARSVLADARQKIALDQAALALAQCHELLGEPAEAEALYQTALEADPNDPAAVRQAVPFWLRNGSAAVAEAALRRLTDRPDGAEETLVRWARRALASLLTAQGGYRRVDEAIQLCQESCDKGRGGPEDQRAYAMTLAAHPKRQRRLEAIFPLETLVQRGGPDTAQARFVLARLYLEKGDWAHYTGHMRRLLGSHGEDPQYVAAYTEALLDRNELSEAALRMGQLERLAPDRPSTAVLKARLEVKRGNADKAIELLSALANPLDPQGEARVERQGLVAQALDRLRDQAAEDGPKEVASRLEAAAEEVYRRWADQRPGAAMLLAAFLARRQRLDESLDVAESAWEEASSTVLASACTTMLAEIEGDRQRLDRLERILRAALEKHEDEARLRIDLADLCIKKGRQGEAEQLYRQVLEAAPNSVPALNNLAILLAHQGKDLREAAEMIESAIERAGPLPALLDSRATVRLALGRPQEALDDVEEAIAEEPRPGRYFHKAQALEGLGRKESAAEALSEARRRGLRTKDLHPLEVGAYEALLAKLG